MTNDNKTTQPHDAVRVFETGIRVALEEMLAGRDYARVEDILRALADGSTVPTCSPAPKED